MLNAKCKKPTTMINVGFQESGHIMFECYDISRKKHRPVFTSVTTSSFWPGSRDNTLYLDDSLTLPSTQMTSRCAIFHIINRGGTCRSLPVKQVSSWSENRNGYVQFGILHY